MKVNIWRANKKNPQAGHSRHEVGRAIDISVVNSLPRERCGKTTSEEAWRRTGFLDIVRQWGDKTNTRTFGSYIDRVHLENIESDSGNGVETIIEDLNEEVTEMKKVKVLDRDL